MSQQVSWVEQWAIRFGLVKDTPPHPEASAPGPLVAAAPPAQWDDWVEVEARGWPFRRVEKHYQLVPTTCFNCESACGLLAFIDKETNEVRKFEGNPVHPASRGRLCA